VPIVDRKLQFPVYIFLLIHECFASEIAAAWCNR